MDKEYLDHVVEMLRDDMIDAHAEMTVPTEHLRAILDALDAALARAEEAEAKAWDANLPQPWNEESANKILALVEDRDGLRRDLAEMTKTAELRLMRALQAEQERDTVKRDRDELRELLTDRNRDLCDMAEKVATVGKQRDTAEARIRELEAALATAEAAYAESLEARRVTEAEGGALNQLNNEIDRLRAWSAELETERDLAKAPASPEPDAWIVETPEGNVIYWTREKREIAEQVAASYDREAIPLYRHPPRPAPADVVTVPRGEWEALRELFAAAGRTIHTAATGGRTTLEEINDAWDGVCSAKIALRSSAQVERGGTELIADGRPALLAHRRG